MMELLAASSFLTFLIGILFALAPVIALWKLFEKAGQPGWAAIIPIFNIIVLLKIAGKPAWWILLCLIPIVNIVILIMTYIGLCKNFGKDSMFAVLAFFFPFIFLLLLAFGDDQYNKVE